MGSNHCIIDTATYPIGHMQSNRMRSTELGMPRAKYPQTTVSVQTSHLNRFLTTD